MPEVPSPDPADLAVRDLAQRVMDDYDSTGYRIEHCWSEGAEMWFTEIEPVKSDAANISLCHGGDTFSFYFGSTWFEHYPMSLDDLPTIETVLRALCEGNFEQAGPAERSFARIYTTEKTWRVGHTHWPVPWRLRRTKRFQAYAS